LFRATEYILDGHSSFLFDSRTSRVNGSTQLIILTEEGAEPPGNDLANASRGIT